MLSATAQLDARAEYGRTDGQGLFVTVWGTGCYVSHVADYFDSRGTDGREPGWQLFFTLAPQEMGRTAGARGAFVAPQSQEYAYRGITVGRLSPLKSSTPAEAWLDDLERVVGLEVRGQVKAWVAGGLSEQRLKKAVRGAVDPRLVYERLRDADKGIYQHRIVIDDYNSVPGTNTRPYNGGNSLPKKKLLAADFLSNDEKLEITKLGIFGVNNAELDLPDYRTETFTKEVRLIKIPPGKSLYRVTDPGGEGGAWWTLEPPKDLAEVIGGTAVMPEWNGFTKVVEAVVPNDGLPFYAWFGPAASQPVSLNYKEKLNNGHSLPGGTEQLFLPNISKNNAIFINSIKDSTSKWKSW